jgi:hypothetical protein
MASEESIYTNRTWTPLKAPELVGDTSALDELPAKGFVKLCASGCWIGWYRNIGTAVYPYAVLVQMGSGEEVVWCLSKYDYFDWVSVYGQAPSMLG